MIGGDLNSVTDLVARKWCCMADSPVCYRMVWVNLYICLLFMTEFFFLFMICIIANSYSLNSAFYHWRFCPRLTIYPRQQSKLSITTEEDNNCYHISMIFKWFGVYWCFNIPWTALMLILMQLFQWQEVSLEIHCHPGFTSEPKGFSRPRIIRFSMQKNHHHQSS